MSIGLNPAALAVNSLSQGSLQAGGRHAPAEADRVHDAAQKFEALLIAQMLKSVREAAKDGLGGGDSSMASMMETAESNVAEMMAASGGFGLARMILAQFDSGRLTAVRSDGSEQTAPAPTGTGQGQ